MWNMNLVMHSEGENLADIMNADDVNANFQQNAQRNLDFL